MRHAALAAAAGLPTGLLVQLLRDVEKAEVSEAFRAAVVYARKLTLDPTRLGPADVEALFAAGHDERALYFLVFVTAVFTMSNRIVQGPGLTTPSPTGAPGSCGASPSPGVCQHRALHQGAGRAHAPCVTGRPRGWEVRWARTPPRGVRHTKGSVETFRPSASQLVIFLYTFVKAPVWGSHESIALKTAVG